MIYGYVKAGNGKQTVEAQQDQLLHYAQTNTIVIDKWFVDSVKEGTQSSLFELKEIIQKNDTVLITDVDRLNKNWNEVISIYNDFILKSVNLLVVNYALMNINVNSYPELIDYKTHQMQLIEVYCNSIMNERRKVSEVTKEALVSLQKQGIQLGRPKKYNHDSIIKMYMSGCTYDEISEELGASRAMISKIVKKHGIQRRRPNGYKEEK